MKLSQLAAAGAAATTTLAATAQHSFQLPDPVKTGIYTTLAAAIGWAVGALLDWLKKKVLR
jgi:hypothetical protein